jgi:FkbM family methyltransferase
MNDRFFPDYVRTVVSAIGNDFTDNYDVRRYGPAKKESASLLQHVKRRLSALLHAAGFVTMRTHRYQLSSALSQLSTALSFASPHIEHFEWLYQNLSDEESRQILVLVLAYRALGHRRVKLPLNKPEYWLTLEKVEALTKGAESIDLGFLNFKAYKMNLVSLGYPMEVFLTPGGVLDALLLQQYRCQAINDIIEVTAGDTVIDAGACYGDTALYFSHKAGAAGHVYSFEFVPEHVAIFSRNMSLNKGLAERIHLIESPLWSTSGRQLFVEGTGPGTRVSPASTDPTAKKIETLAIDDFVRREHLSSVDFIKMDIEGAELEALKGAEKTIRSCRPKFAISVYHKLHDFWTIPKYIDQLGLGYRFSLRHFTIHHEETVLFAAPSS